LSFWQAEASQLVQKHGTLSNAQFRLHKLTAFVDTSSELFEDSALLEPYLAEVVGKEFMFQVNEALINGSGVGQPLGVVNAPGTITVAKDVGQATKTLSFSKLSNMWTQFHGPCRYGAPDKFGVWYAQEDIDPDTLAMPVSAPASWTGAAQFPTFKGRPFLPLENCQPIGTPGDIILADWNEYVLFMGGMRSTVSMDFHFDTHQSQFRFVWRCGGQPLWETALVPRHSTISKSAFVVLATR
jgi:hypothetical protein